MRDSITFKIAGIVYRKTCCQYKAWHMPIGTRIEIVPEPVNKHDPNALAVYVLPACQLGYVPRIMTADIRWIMKEDYEAVALSNARVRVSRIKPVAVSHNESVRKPVDA